MPTSVSLSQLTDLALGTPEVGAVNFNVLHTLLHAIIGKLKIQDSKAEIDDSDRDFLSRRQVLLSAGVQSDKDSGKGEDSEDAMSEKSGAVHPVKKKVSSYHQLELRVEKLAEKIEQLNALPSSRELYGKATGVDTSGRPVADMWQGLQLKKRVDANEEGINKLCSLIEDMMKEIRVLKDSSNDLLKKFNSIDLDSLNKRLDDLAQKNDELNAKFATLPSPEEISTFVTWPGLEDALRGVRDTLEALSRPMERVVIDMSSQTDVPSRPSSSRPSTRQSSLGGPTSELLDMLEKLGNLTADHDLLTKRVDVLEDEMKNKADKGDLKDLGASKELWNELQKMKDEMDRFKDMSEKGVPWEVIARVDELEAMIKELGGKMDTQSLTRAQQAILQLQSELDRLHNTTQAIIDDNNARSKDMENLLAYCDRLQERKADKEFVAKEVDVKADKRQLETKVNTSLFDSTTNDINNMIKDILNQLVAHEEDWKRAYSQLSDDIDTKLDRLELDPLKEWLEARLKALNKKIQQSAAASTEWGDDEAAGLRKQLLQRFHCLSCDRPVEMMAQGGRGVCQYCPMPSIPQAPGMPATRSPRPYTTYELDQIRQHAKKIYFGFERPKSARAAQDVTDYYATTRQCGGSHTMTYPHKRTTRLTHLSNLLKEEDGAPPPEQPYPVYKEEVDVQGVDGHIYKGRVERVQLEAKLPSSMTGAPPPQPSTGRGPAKPAAGDSGSAPYPQPPSHRVSSPRPGSRSNTRLTQRPTSRTAMRPTSARQSGGMPAQAGPGGGEEMEDPDQQEAPVVIPALDNEEAGTVPPPTESAEDGTVTEPQAEGEGEDWTPME